MRVKGSLKLLKKEMSDNDSNTGSNGGIHGNDARFFLCVLVFGGVDIEVKTVTIFNVLQNMLLSKDKSNSNFP